MRRPLLISDCDDVLLHMIGHFADYVAEAHGMTFALDEPSFREAITYTADGRPVEEERIWPLLESFFDNEMHRQDLVPGAGEALRRIGEVADIVILTNVGDAYEAARIEQLGRFDIRHKVLCNRGPKGAPLKEIVAQMNPSVTVFVDDLAQHHESVAEHAPDVWRLHMIAEPRIAVRTPPAPFAHARIDRWDEAVEWVLDKLTGGPAPIDALEDEPA